MLAGLTDQADIRAQAYDFPLITSAWMSFAHSYNIIDGDISKHKAIIPVEAAIFEVYSACYNRKRVKIYSKRG